MFLISTKQKHLTKVFDIRLDSTNSQVQGQCKGLMGSPQIYDRTPQQSMIQVPPLYISIFIR